MKFSFKYIKQIIKNRSKMLIKDIKEISKHNPHAEIKDKVKEYLDNNIDKWVKSLEIFNEFSAGRYSKYAEIPFTINHPEFNTLSFNAKIDIISEIIYIDPTYTVKLKEGENNQLIILLTDQTSIYLFCKTFGYVDKLMEAIAKTINKKITHSLHKNSTTIRFEVCQEYQKSFRNALRDIFPDCYFLEFKAVTNSHVFRLVINWQ